MKDTVFIVDGLPASSKPDVLLSKITNKEVYYLNFISELSDFTPQNIETKLNHYLCEVSHGKKLTIVVVSFGAYIILHSKDVLNKFFKNINCIYAYSPVARLENVQNLDTLPGYLNKKYRLDGSKLKVKDFKLFDRCYDKQSLIDGDLLAKTNIISGSNDNQIDNNLLQEYYKDFNLKIIDTDHIGLSKLTKIGDLPWM